MRMSKTDETLRFRRLQLEGMRPARDNAAEPDLKLERTIADWLPEPLDKTRTPLAGSKAE